MLYHYPSEFRLIAEFLQCIHVLGQNQVIVHDPRMSSYHFENGQKAAKNLILYPQQRLFVMNLANVYSKKNQWDKYDEFVNIWSDISILSNLKLSKSVSSKIYGSLSKLTPYAPEYESTMKTLLFTQCTADKMRYQCQYKNALQEYQKSLSLIQCLFDAKPSKHSKKSPNQHTRSKDDFLPLLKMQCAIKRKYAKCLLHLRDPKSLQKCSDLCGEILAEQSVLDDLQIAKTKLCIAQCLLLQIQHRAIMHIIWRGNEETAQLQDILVANMNEAVTDMEEHNVEMDIQYIHKFDTNGIAAVLYIRQNLIQCLLIFIHLTTVNPELIKQTSFALAYIYGLTNVEWTAMFLNMAQSVITRHGAIKQYEKQLQNIHHQWEEFKIADKKYNRREAPLRDIKNEQSVDLEDINMNHLTASMRKLKINKKRKEYSFNKADYLSHEEYKALYTKFQHKLLIVKYYQSDRRFLDYHDLPHCYQLIDAMRSKFYSQTVDFLQYSWNCVSVEVDELLRTMLVCVINPSSVTRKAATEMTVVEIPINRNRNDAESKQEEDQDNDDEDDDGFLNTLYFHNDTDHDDEHEMKHNANPHHHKYDRIMRDFNAFLKEANESTHSGKDCTDKDDIKSWWEKRFQLDTMLKNHLQSIESDILGFFRCLFIPNFRDENGKKLIKSACKSLVQAINEYLQKKTNDEYLTTCLIDTMRDKRCNEDITVFSPKMLLFQKFLQLMYICHGTQNAVEDREIAQCLTYIFKVHDSYVMNKLLGTVKEQISIIHEKFSSEFNAKEFDSLLFTIGDTLKHIPWESIAILQRIVPSICRVPCLEFAALRVLEYSKYKHSKDEMLKYYYIINPKGDLKKTESRFDRLLNEEWTGIKNKVPSLQQFQDGLEKHDVFLYVGHNGGEEFVNYAKLETFNIKSITFLMGCSSGLLRKKGEFQSNGITNYYMIASCPIIVANLWDVTDKDIDQFSSQMLRKCVLKKEHLVDIPKAVNVSRSVCKLKYLNGAAPICYGIPFHLFNGIHV